MTSHSQEVSSRSEKKHKKIEECSQECEMPATCKWIWLSNYCQELDSQTAGKFSVCQTSNFISW